MSTLPEHLEGVVALGAALSRQGVHIPSVEA